MYVLVEIAWEAQNADAVRNDMTHNNKPEHFFLFSSQMPGKKKKKLWLIVCDMGCMDVRP
jgi:hypothetical protein